MFSTGYHHQQQPVPKVRNHLEPRRCLLTSIHCQSLPLPAHPFLTYQHHHQFCPFFSSSINYSTPFPSLATANLNHHCTFLGRLLPTISYLLHLFSHPSILVPSLHPPSDPPAFTFSLPPPSSEIFHCLLPLLPHVLILFIERSKQQKLLFPSDCKPTVGEFSLV